MSYDKIKSLIEQQLAEIQAAGLYKTERVLLGPQGGSICVAQGTVINLCANNYLGLADHPAIVEAAAHAVRMRGYGMAAGRRIRLIATDGVFSMDGDFARLDAIVELAERYGALVMVDDSHATGFIGPTGRGTPELFGVADKVDLITSTLGKAVGGGTGGFTAGQRELIELLRQRSRPYLFSNAVPPMICAAGLKALELIRQGDELRRRLEENARFLRQSLEKLGFKVRPGTHPIMPVMLGDAALAVRMADRLLEEGVYVIGFSYPVVPKGEARIRVQVSAAHTREQLTQAVTAFEKVGRELGVIS